MGSRFIFGRFAACFGVIAALFMTACVVEEEGDTKGSVNLNLNDTWVRETRIGESTDIEIIIMDSIGVFSKINSGNWDAARKAGYVQVGDIKIKNIKQLNEYNWICSDLWCDYNGTDVTDVAWEDDCILAMHEDGAVISITHTQEASYSYTLVRKK